MTPDRGSNIQEDFFNRARKEGGAVVVFLTNGKKLTGRLKAFDKFTVILEANRVDQMIFKHAISTVSVARPGAPLPRGRMPPGVEGEAPDASESESPD